MPEWTLTQVEWERLSDSVKRIEHNVEELSEQVLGNGEPEKGLRMRVASLEDFRSTVKKLAIAVVGVGGTGGTGLLAYLKGMFGHS